MNNEEIARMVTNTATLMYLNGTIAGRYSNTPIPTIVYDALTDRQSKVFKNEESIDDFLNYQKMVLGAAYGVNHEAFSGILRHPDDYLKGKITIDGQLEQSEVIEFANQLLSMCFSIGKIQGAMEYDNMIGHQTVDTMQDIIIMLNQQFYFLVIKGRSQQVIDHFKHTYKIFGDLDKAVKNLTKDDVFGLDDFIKA